MKTIVRTLTRQQSGTAMVEMALVLPILLLLVVGLVDIARAMNYWNDTNQLAGEAARHAAVNRNPGSSSGLTFAQYIRSKAETAEVRDGTSSSVQSQLNICKRTPQGTDVGDPITIRVSTRYYVIPLIKKATDDAYAGNGFGSIGLTGEATMRLEQQFTQTLPDCAP
jgi:Flp pilus assembly protein TadG